MLIFKTFLNNKGQGRSSPYLEPNRLADLLAAIQSMSLFQSYRAHIREWSDLISGNEGRAAYWQRVFDDHPEFFRKSGTHTDHYALVWRRAQNRRYHSRLHRYVTEEEYDVLPVEEKRRYMSRAPVPEAQIKTLMDTAINLHQRAVESSRDWRWWVAPAVAAGGSFVGAIVGGLFKTH